MFVLWVEFNGASKVFKLNGAHYIQYPVLTQCLQVTGNFSTGNWNKTSHSQDQTHDALTGSFFADRSTKDCVKHGQKAGTSCNLKTSTGDHFTFCKIIKNIMYVSQLNTV